MPLACALLGTWPTTQACALMGNQTSDPSQDSTQSTEPHQPGPCHCLLNFCLCFSLHLSVSPISTFSSPLSPFSLFFLSLSPAPSLSLSLSPLYFPSVSVSLSVSLVNGKEVPISRAPADLRRTPRTCRGRGCPRAAGTAGLGGPHSATPS